VNEKVIAGWKLYYGDGSVVSSRYSIWEDAVADDVQVLIVYFSETYKIWHGDHWDEESYRDMYFGKDYFWPFGNGQASDVPSGVSVKLGRELPYGRWHEIYEAARKDVRL